MHLTNRVSLWCNIHVTSRKCSEWCLLWSPQRLAPGASAPLPYTFSAPPPSTSQPHFTLGRKAAWSRGTRPASAAGPSLRPIPDLSLSLAPPARPLSSDIKGPAGSFHPSLRASTVSSASPSFRFHHRRDLRPPSPPDTRNKHTQETTEPFS